MAIERQLINDATKNTALRNSLLEGDPFVYAHLVKFEKPLKTEDGKSRGEAKDYSYITDGSYPITFDDGSTYEDSNNSVQSNGPQVYLPGKLTKVGQVAESTAAKASNINISLTTAALGVSIGTGLNPTNISITASNTIEILAGGIDFVEAGFREGDRIILKKVGGSNDEARVRIDKFTNNNFKAEVTPLYKNQTINGAIEPLHLTALTTETATYILAFDSPEIESVLSNRSEGTYARYINRDVFIYKAHINPDTGVIIGDPYLIFKGIIASGKLTENPEGQGIINWALTSHWGDFIRVNGRLTSDPHHRGLDENLQGDPEAAKRPAYANDLGFLHSEAAINLIATYEVDVTKTKMKRKGGLKGINPFGNNYKQVEYTVQEEREADLRFDLDAKYLPVVYGVNKVSAIPVFVDTLNNDAATVFVAYAICEGKIGGIYDIYFDGIGSVCVDKNENDTRGTADDNNVTDVVCFGRMDRGDVLEGKVAATGSSFEMYGHEDTAGTARWGQHMGSLEYYDGHADGVDEDTSRTDTSVNEFGITDGKQVAFNTPIDTLMTIHTGSSDQIADSMLVANKSNFKVGTDYYGGKESYWGANHRLLDTAYVVAKYTIGEGETTIPTPEFVVRGKPVSTFNYDYSYELYTTNVTNASTTEFNLGEVVNLKAASGSIANQSLDVATGRIADIYNIRTSSGTLETRIRLVDKPTLTVTDTSTDPDTITVVSRFYIEKTSDSSKKIYLRTWDDLLGSGSVQERLESEITTTTTAVAGGAGVGQTDVVMSGASSDFLTGLAFQDAIVAIHANGGSSGQSYGRDLTSNYTNWTANTSQKKIVGIGNTATDNSVLTGQKVTVVNAVSIGASATAAYLNKWFRIKKKKRGGTRKRGLLSILGFGTNVVKFKEGIDADMIPDNEDFWEVFSSSAVDGPFDARITTNPALHLLEYMTNDRYGRELDLDKDIDLDSFLDAARDCDTRSDVTLVLTLPAQVGTYYHYQTSGGKTLWFGKCKSVTTVTVGSSTTRYNTVFTNVGGKIVHRWEDWKYFYTGELYYYENGGVSGLHQASSNGVISSTPSTTSSVSSLSISKIDTSSTPLSIDLTRNSFDGNPVVKTAIANASLLQALPSGYSLYDSDNVKYWRYLGWDSQNQRHVTRHQTNTVIDTSIPLFENVNTLLGHFNGTLRYARGKYALAVRKAAEDVNQYTINGTPYVVEDVGVEDIVGSINIEDSGHKGTYNSVAVSFDDPQNRFESRSISVFNSKFLKQDRGIKKDGSTRTPYITNYYNARINANQYLESSRTAIKINFTMSPKGLLYRAGDIIRVTYPRFEWVNKKYRITNLNFLENCLVQVTAEEHSDDTFLILPERKNIRGNESNTANVGQPVAPSALTATDNRRGGIQLDWGNSSRFNPTTHKVEIYRSSVNNRNDTSHLDTDPPTAPLLKKIATVIGNTYTDPILEDGLVNRYYWVRYAVNRPSLRASGIAPREVFSDYNPSSATGAAVGSALGAVDGITISMSRDSVIVLADEAGNNPDLSNTNNVIKVYISGSAPIAYDGASPFANNSFRVTNVSATGVVSNNGGSGSGNAYTQAPLTDMAGDTGALTYTIVVKDPIGVEKTFEKIQSFSKSKRGEFGKTAELVSNKYVINYSTEGTETDSLVLTATARNFGATTPFFEFFVDKFDGNGFVSKGTSAVGSGTPPNKAFTLPDSDEPALGATVSVKVQIREGSASGTITAEDSVSIYAVQDGTDAITAFLTNPSHTVGANPQGQSNVGAGGGDFRVFVGGQNVTTSCSFSVLSESGVDMSIGASSGTYTVTSFADANISGTATFRASVPANIAKIEGSNPVIIDQVYSISKAKEGVAAKVVHLDSTDYSIVYDSTGATPAFTSPSDDANVVRFTASAQGYLSPQYRFTVDGTAGSFGNSNVHNITYAGTSFSASDRKDVVKVEVREGSSGSPTAEDSVSIVKVKSGSAALTTHEVILYQAVTAGTSYAAPPADPSSAVYNFSTGSFTSGLGSWSQNFPQLNRRQLAWSISASPQTSLDITSTTTDTLTASDFSYPIQVASPEGTNVCYKYHTSGTSAPAIANQTALTEDIVDAIPSGWYDTPAIAALPANKSSSQVFLWQSIGHILNESQESGGQRSGSRARWLWIPGKRLDGSDAYTVILSNEAHAFPASNSGAVSSTANSGTTIEVLRGGTTLTGVASGEPTADQFKVVSSGTNITPSSSRGSAISGGFIEYADHSAGTIMSGVNNTSAEIEYTITVSTGDTQQIVTKKQNFTKVGKGEDSATIDLTNAAHSLSTTSAGVVTYTGSGTDITVKLGATSLPHDNSGSPATPSFRVTSAIGTNITVGAASTVSTNIRRFANHSNMTQDNAKVVFTIIVRDNAGVETTFTRDQSLSKTIQGVDGNAVAEVNLYYAVTFGAGTVTAQSAPSTGTYNFNTGVISSIPSGWSQTKPSNEIGKIAFQSVALATDSGSGTSGSLSWSTPFLADSGLAATNFIFKYSATQPTTPPQTGAYSGSIPSGWDDGIPSTQPAGTKLWSSKGTSALTGPLSSLAFRFTWETPILHVQAKADVGLGNAEDKSSSDIRDEIEESDLVGSSKVFTGGKPNKIEVQDGSVDGLWRINVDEGGFADVGVFSSSSRTAFGHLKVGTDPVAGSGSIRNTNVQMNTDGSISVTGNGTGNPTMNTLTDAGNIRSRITAGLDSSGNVDRAVAVNKGGTGQTNVNTFRNDQLSVSQGSSGVFTLGRGGYSGNTTTITKSLLNLNYADGADVTSANTAADVTNVSGTASATVKNGAVRANAGLDASGNVARAVPSSRLTNINTASVNQPVFIWTELSNAGFSPTATSFTFIINWKDGAGNNVAESRWTATRDTNNDDIDAGGITNNYSGSGVTSSQSGANTTSSTVTFTRGTTSVKVTASIVSFTGFTFKE